VFISSILIKENQNIQVKYVGEAGCVTRHSIPTTNNFKIDWDRLKQALFTHMNLDSTYVVEDSHMTRMDVELTSFGKETLADDPGITDVEIAAIAVNLSIPRSETTPAISMGVTVPWGHVERNDDLINAIERLTKSTIEVLKFPVEIEAKQLKLELAPVQSQGLRILRPPTTSVPVDGQSLEVEDYDYDPADLLDKNGSPLANAALTMRKRSLISKGLAIPKEKQA
jgi:hypothetical protein